MAICPTWQSFCGKYYHIVPLCQLKSAIFGNLISLLGGPSGGRRKGNNMTYLYLYSASLENTICCACRIDDLSLWGVENIFRWPESYLRFHRQEDFHHQEQIFETVDDVKLVLTKKLVSNLMDRARRATAQSINENLLQICCSSVLGPKNEKAKNSQVFGFQCFMVMGRGGFEPPTHGFSVRWSCCKSSIAKGLNCVFSVKTRISTQKQVNFKWGFAVVTSGD